MMDRILQHSEHVTESMNDKPMTPFKTSDPSAIVFVLGMVINIIHHCKVFLQKHKIL